MISCGFTLSYAELTSPDCSFNGVVSICSCNSLVYRNNSSQTVHGCFFSYGSLPTWADHSALLSDLSSCPHCMVVLGLALESVTLTSSSGFNQQLSPHGQPQTAASCTLMSRESQARPSRSSHCSVLSSFSHHSKNHIQ